LGLAVSKKLPKQTAAAIKVQSEVGVGSTFTLILASQKNDWIVSLRGRSLVCPKHAYPQRSEW